MEKINLTPQECAQILGVTERTIRVAYIPILQKEKVKCLKFRRRWLIDRIDFMKWYENQNTSIEN